ncbi:MAG: GNAT family N-acetyltransferase [Defluviitaleaceae bacterium]|nr:GNAT family N-acetyltransferase [Defluviitaleaceae bacterium]
MSAFVDDAGFYFIVVLIPLPPDFSLKTKSNILLMRPKLYEFSQYHHWDVRQDGLYGCYFEEEYREKNGKYAAFFIEADDKLAGFVMIGDGINGDKKTDYQVNELFVMHKYRRLGIGKQALFKIFDSYKGTWQVVFHPVNTASARFWERIADEYTGGKYELIKSHPHEDYSFHDGTPGDVIYFSSII